MTSPLDFPLEVSLAIAGIAAALGGLLGLWLAPVTALFVPYPDDSDDPTPPPPQCPHCGHVIPWPRWAPVPPLLFTRRDCPHCARQIGGDLLVPVLLAGACGGLAIRFDPGVELLAFTHLAAVLVPLAVIDARTHRLPDRLVLPAYPVAAILLGVAAARVGTEPLWGAAVGLLGLAGVYTLAVLIFGRGIGRGDLKIAGLLGAYLGWTGILNVVVALYLWTLLSAVYGLATAVVRWRLAPRPEPWRVALRTARATVVPLGPFMMVGTLGAVIAGPWTAQMLSALLFP